MTNECEYCGKSFEKLSQLYMHKNTHTPSLLLHQHPHPAFGEDSKQLVPVNTKHKIKADSAHAKRIKPYIKKRKSDTKIKSYTKSLSDDEQRNPNLKIVDTYERSVKRKRDDNDSVFEMPNSEDRVSKRRKVDDENDSGLEVIDSYDRIGNKIKRGVEKNNRVKNRKFRKYSDDDQQNPKSN